MKRLIIVFLLLLVIITSGCDSKRKPETINQKRYDLNCLDELNGTSDIIESYEKYLNLTNKHSINVEYTEDYFLKNSLVIVYLGESSSSNSSEIVDYSIKGQQFSVIINTNYGDTCDEKTSLILLEINSNIISKINRIKIIQNDKDVTKISTDLNKDFLSFTESSYKFNGNLCIINNYDDYCSLSCIDLFQDKIVDQSYFRFNSIIFVTFNYNTYLSDLVVETKSEDNNLMIDVSSLKELDYTHTFIGLIEISNNYLYSFDDVRLLVSGEDVTKNEEMLNFKYLNLPGYHGGEYSGNYRIVNSYEDLLKYQNVFDQLVEKYSDFDFTNKSLIIIRGSSGTRIVYSEMWSEVHDSELVLYTQVLQYSALTAAQNYILCVEMNKDILENISTIKQVFYSHENGFITSQASEYNNLHTDYYVDQYFKSKFVNNQFQIIDSFNSLTKEVGDYTASNYYSDFFDKGRVLIYFYEIPKNYRLGIPTYKVEDNILYVEVMYIELNYDENRDTKRYVMIDGLAEILDNVSEVKLILIEFEPK